MSEGASSFIRSAAPRVANLCFAVLNGLSKLEPLFSIVAKQYASMMVVLEPYNPEAIFEMTMGIILMFFGGQFITLVRFFLRSSLSTRKRHSTHAATLSHMMRTQVSVGTALKQGGSGLLLEQLKELWAQAKKASKAKQEDDQVDDDGDGIADVEQIDSNQLFQRRIKVVATAVDPQVVSNAMGFLYTSMLAALASLKLRFARTISLGASIGSYAIIPVQKFVVPIVETVTPHEYHKWLPSVFGYLCKLIGASVAFAIQRVLSTVTTGVAGGHALLSGFEKFIVSRNDESMMWMTEGLVDDVLAWALAVFGIYAQLFLFSSLPAPIRLLLSPLYVLEGLLSVFVSTR